VAAGVVAPADMNAFRTTADSLRDTLGSAGVGVIGAALGGKASVITVVTDDLVKRGLHAGDIVKEVARLVGGSGGGKPHLAQAGGKDPDRLAAALGRVPEIVRVKLGGAQGPL
jgi:alanyl-tRNA synthetase